MQSMATYFLCTLLRKENVWKLLEYLKTLLIYQQGVSKKLRQL